jgi:uracil-DNA glycosylase family 4
VTAAVPTDEIYERYLRKAIGEINELQHELLALADETHVPVLGSGHPLGDVFLLKHAPQQAEITEGVAFFGRSGNALLKSLQRLDVDPLSIYGTNCLKFGTEEDEQAAPWLTRELRIVQPRLLVVMGEAAVEFLDAETGVVRRLTPTIEALVTPDIDTALDDQATKKRFWNGFKALGPWWAELPPY